MLSWKYIFKTIKSLYRKKTAKNKTKKNSFFFQNLTVFLQSKGAGNNKRSRV